MASDFVQKQWSSALDKFSKSLEESPQDSVCMSNRAAVYLALELNRKCIKDCDAAIAVDELNLRAYILKGRAYQCLKKGKKATSAYQQGVAAGAKGGDVFLFRELGDLAAGKMSPSTAAVSVAAPVPAVAIKAPPPAPPPAAVVTKSAAQTTEAKRQTAKQVLSDQSTADVDAADMAARSKMVNHGSGIQEVDQVSEIALFLAVDTLRQ
jgi:tetratricopeptide (TPR) repeat protein